jgi:hypothetical protein
MVMPDKFAFHLHQFDLGIIQFADDLRRIIIGEEGQFLSEVNLFHTGRDELTSKQDDEFSSSAAAKS